MTDKALLGQLHPAAKLIFTLMVCLFSTLLVVLIGVVASIPFMGEDALNSLMGSESSLRSENLHFTKYLQILSHLGLFIIPAFVLAWLFGKRIWKYLFADFSPRTEVWVLSAMIIVAIVPFIGYLVELNMQMKLPAGFEAIESWMRNAEQAAELVTRKFLGVSTWQALAFNIFMIAIIPALGEEFIFRGVLLRIFKDWTNSKHAAVWITAIIFSAIHMQFFGFFPRMILGVLFGYMVIWSGSIWPAVLAHFINNALAVTLFFLSHNEYIATETYDNIGKGSSALIWAVMSLLLSLGLLYVLKKKAQKPNPLSA